MVGAGERRCSIVTRRGEWVRVWGKRREAIDASSFGDGGVSSGYTGEGGVGGDSV